MTGIFAVGGGLNPVLLVLLLLMSPPDFRFFPEEEEGALLIDGRRDGSSPYFSTSCLIELYLVAALSFSIVSSRSLTIIFRYASAEEIR